MELSTERTYLLNRGSEMKRACLIALLVTMALAAVVDAAPAEARQLIAFGARDLGDDPTTYGYLELSLAPTLALGIEYRSEGVMSASLRHGVVQGIYGELQSRTDGDEQLLEIGGWRAMPLGQSLGLTGRIGAQGELGGTGIWARASAELNIDVTDQVALLAGAEMTLLKKDGRTSTWLGVGYSF